jgi:hypothetical protein
MQGPSFSTLPLTLILKTIGWFPIWNITNPINIRVSMYLN